MWALIKKYWDIFGGIITGLLLSLLAKWKLDKIQLIYSIIILILVSIGVFRIIKQSIDKNKQKRKKTLIEAAVDSQKPVKAIHLAQNPTKDGEELGRTLLKTWEEIKKVKVKIKTFFDKFKGYLLTIALGILTLVEMLGGYLNELCSGKLSINGIDIIPLVTLVASIVVGIVSNGYTKEQKEKIKALFSRSSTNELVIAEIKKQLKEKEAQLKEFNKLLSTKENELDNLNSEMESKKNTLEAKKEMLGMTPQLATVEDVQLASEAVNLKKVDIDTKKTEIEEIKKSINNLSTTINALKSQL